MFQSYLWQILVQKHSSIQVALLCEGGPFRSTKTYHPGLQFLPGTSTPTYHGFFSLHEICQTQGLANLLPHHSTTWDDGSHDVEDFLQILREVSGEIHHNSDGGKEANDARCIIKDMFLTKRCFRGSHWKEISVCIQPMCLNAFEKLRTALERRMLESQFGCSA